MSGIVGIVNRDREPVDPWLLRSMTDYMAFRGPDKKSVWLRGNIAFGHTLLRTTVDSEHERQPSTLDGDAWIVADARLDGRRELVCELKSKGCEKLHNAADSDLILHAYRIWGDACVDHLIGDFVFAIWDSRHQRLFCARDQFGVRPFYYANVGSGSLAFSNTLDCVRMHPAVSSELNDLAIANFLLFRYQPKLDITSFADIRALPPAHTLTWEHGAVLTKRYWELPTEQEFIRYRRSEDYVEKFLDLFDTAVGDRLRTNRAAVYMSGGMDSTAVAATARHLLAESQRPFDLRAYTIVYDHLIPDQERYWSGLVSEHLGIPINHIAVDDVELFQGWDQDTFHMPEPQDLPRWIVDDIAFGQIDSTGIRVVLTGLGGDPLLLSEPRYALNLIRHGQIGRLITESGSLLLRYGKLPRLGIRTLLRRWLGRVSEDFHDPEYLRLLNAELVTRLRLPRPWWQNPWQPPEHPLRQNTYAQMVDPYWPLCFQPWDASWTRRPLEFRYPFFDLRLVKFMLAIPPLPWCVNKTLLRRAMAGRLPKAVCSRPKSPLAGHPQHPWARWATTEFVPAPGLGRYLDIGQSVRYLTQQPRRELEHVTRLVALNHWMRQYRSAHRHGRNWLKQPIRRPLYTATGTAI